MNAMDDTGKYYAKKRINAMIRLLEMTTARAVEAIAKEAENEGCFIAGPPDEFGDPCFNLPCDLGMIGDRIQSEIGNMLTAVNNWTGEAPDKSGEYGA